MSLTWRLWTSVSEGASTPGAPVSALPWEDSYALFISDPGGSIYAIKAVPGYGWEAVPGLTSTPGAPVTALPLGDGFTLFAADANGGIVTTSGHPYQSWAPWTSVSDGASTPGAPVTALPWDGSYALFISDPSGGVYAIKATPDYGWEAVPGLTTKPGAPVTAMGSAGGFTLFAVDANGGIVTTSGLPYQGWAPWTSVSDGASTPGAPVTALPWDGSYALFISDPSGGIYTIKATPGYGWEAVPGLTGKPGAPVTAVRWYRPPTDDSPSLERFLLFVTEVGGGIFTTSGIPYQGWDSWTSIPKSLTVPGSQVTACSPLPSYGPFTLFAADASGAVRETTTASPPAKPDLAVASVTAEAISVSWSESNPASVELAGFLIEITRMPADAGGVSRIFVSDPLSRTFTFSPLNSGVQHEIQLSAFNDNGYSAKSIVRATTASDTPKG